jgi:hypothetical protein
MRDFSTIPARACVMGVGEFAIGDNGENAKTAPLSMKARSGQPIEHWYWGRVVHDLSGMRLAKNRVAVDYCHDDKEIVGYLNKFDATSGDLMASGALVPFKDNDRATEIAHKMKAGVPYEASINFGGDGIKLEDVPEGMVAQVNGYAFAGPGVIVREWPLRGVAVCPYGADQNTESANAFAGNKTFSAQVVPTNPEPTTKVTAMSATVEAVASEQPAAMNEQTQEQKPAESVTEAAQAPVEETPVEAEPQPEPTATPEPEPTPEPTESDKLRAQFARMRADFGDAIAAEVYEKGGDYNAALSLAYQRAKQEVSDLAARVAEFAASQSATGTPVKVTVAKEKARLFNTGK